MKERINWIDWAKALAVCCVVFCHFPQSQELFYYRYLQAVIIVIFFFLSGYLKKDRGCNKANWQKYWHGLILPYLLYNAIVYPYWLFKYYMQNGTLPDLFSAFKPIFGALMFENENSFCEPLNGPLWYLPAILIMHVAIDLCRKTRHQHYIMITLCVISFFLYAANKYWYFAPNLTPMGLLRNLPYYYIGYVFGQYRLFRENNKYGLFYNRLHYLTGCIFCLTVSILLFAWHLDAFYSGRHLLHIVLFYPVNLGFLFGFLYGCKILDSIHWTVVTNLSIGTLVIIGLHIVFVTIANFALSHFSSLIFHSSFSQGSICYEWYEAIPVTLIIVASLYPVIIFGRKHTPYLLGR